MIELFLWHRVAQEHKQKNLLLVVASHDVYDNYYTTQCINPGLGYCDMDQKCIGMPDAMHYSQVNPLACTLTRSPGKSPERY